MKTRSARIKLRHTRIRASIVGTNLRPRLAVHFSGRHIYAQIIDDSRGMTLVSACTTEAKLRSNARSNVKTAVEVGAMLSERAKHCGITKVVFDRGGFSYHGRVKAIADSIRESGLEF